MLITDGIDIAASPEVVWDVFADVERWPEWTASMRSVELLDGPLRVGARAKIRQPKLPSTLWTVTELTPGKSWTWVATTPGAKTVATHTVSAKGLGTAVEQSIEQTGPLGRVFGRLYRGLTRKYVAMEAAGLKQRCETPVPTSTR